MLYTLFAIPVTALLHLEDIAYTLMQKSVFHFLAMYTLLQIHFYLHKEQFISVDYPPHSSIHVRNNGHTSAFAPNPDVSNLRFLNQLIQTFQNIIIKNKIYSEMPTIKCNPLLSGYKRKSSPQF